MDLVTGATGFIGSHLAERLVREGRDVRVLVRKGSEAKLPEAVRGRLEIAHGDLRDKDSLFAATRGATRIYHCAGHVLDWGTEEEFQQMNVRATVWLLSAAEEAKIERFVHMSSIAVFGTPSPPAFDDTTPIDTTSADLYSKTKAIGETLVLDAAREGLPATVLRPAVVYGPRGTWLEYPMQMIEQGKFFLLGGGSGTCHPCYIENLLDATMLVAVHPDAVGEAFIVGDDDPITFREYFGAVARIAGKDQPKRSIPLGIARLTAGAMELGAKAFRSSSRPLLTQSAIHMVTTTSTMSVAKLRSRLGWTPRYSFEKAVDELRTYYEERARALPV